MNNPLTRAQITSLSKKEFLADNDTINLYDWLQQALDILDIAALPSQTSNSGKYLTTNGTVLSWSTLPSQLPSQTSNSGKYLTTNGSTASWGTITIPAAVTPGGSTKQIQYNNAGAFAGSSQLIFNASATNTLDITGSDSSASTFAFRARGSDGAGVFTVSNTAQLNVAMKPIAVGRMVAFFGNNASSSKAWINLSAGVNDDTSSHTWSLYNAGSSGGLSFIYGRSRIAIGTITPLDIRPAGDVIVNNTLYIGLKETYPLFGSGTVLGIHCNTAPLAMEIKDSASNSIFTISDKGSLNIVASDLIRSLTVQGADTEANSVRIGSTAPNTPTILLRGNSVDGDPCYILALTAGSTDPSLILGTTSNKVNQLVLEKTGNILINTSTNNPRAILNVSSTSKGFLPPVMTTAQRDAVTWVSGDKGMLLFNSTTNKHQGWDGTTWNDLY